MQNEILLAKRKSARRKIAFIYGWDDLALDIYFSKFGNDVIDQMQIDPKGRFEVYFWINIRQIIERRIIESNVWFRIDALFREAGLVIAFLQGDVHFEV